MNRVKCTACKSIDTILLGVSWDNYQRNIQEYFCERCGLTFSKKKSINWS